MIAAVLRAIFNRPRPVTLACDPVDPVAEALRLRIQRERASHARCKALQADLNRHTEALLWRGHRPIDGGAA
jgi:hypothetical protein